MTQAAVDAVGMMRAPAPMEPGAEPSAGAARPAGGREGIAAEFARLLRAAANLDSASDTTALDAAFAPLALEPVAPEQVEEVPEDSEETDAELALLPELQADAANGEQTAPEQPAEGGGRVAGVDAGQAAARGLRVERPAPAETTPVRDAGAERTTPEPQPSEELQAGAPAPRNARSTTSAAEIARESNADRANIAAADAQRDAGTEQRLAVEAGGRANRDGDDRSRDPLPMRVPMVDPLEAASGTRPTASGQPVVRSEAPALDSRIVPEIPARNEHELLNRVRMLADSHGGTARIQLQPPQLGGLDVKLTVTDRFVQLDLVADRMPVAELLGRHLPELQSALESHGLRIDRANIEFRDRDLAQQQSSSDRGQGGDGNERRGGGEHREDPRETHDRMLRTAILGSLGAVDVRV
jgi:flagellar hook-length control protein FliK